MTLKQATDAQSSQGIPDWAVRIKALRKRLGMSQTAFGAAVLTSQISVYQWERGRHKPSPDAFSRISALSEGSEKDFFTSAAIPFTEGLHTVLSPEDLIALELGRAIMARTAANKKVAAANRKIKEIEKQIGGGQ